MSVQTPRLSDLRPGPNNDTDALQSAVRRARQRIRALMLLRFGSLGLLCAAVLGMALVGLGKARLIAMPTSLMLAVLIGVGVLIGAALAFWPRLSDLDVAKLTERRADLKERLSSAVEFRQQGVDPSAPFYGEQWMDANHYAMQINVNALYPARIPRTLPIGIILALLPFLMFFLPTLPAFWSPQQKKDAEDVKVTAIAIEKVAEDTQKAAEQQKLDEAKKAAQDVKALANKMKMGQMDKKVALVSMQKLNQKLEEQSKKLEDGLPKKSMEEAAKQFKQSLDQMQKDVERSQQQKSDPANAKKQPPKNGMKPQEKAAQDAQQKQADAMKKMMQAMQQMQQAMQMNSPAQMQQAMQNMAQQMQQNGSQMTPQQMQQMQQAMQQLSQALQSTQMQQMAQQMQQMAQQMAQQMNNMTPQQMQQLAQALKQMAGMCNNPGMKGMGMPRAMMNAKMLAQLMQALKDGRLTMCMGGKPGFGGKGPGSGIGGSGNLTKAMKDPASTKPRMLLANQSEMSKALGKQGDPKKFAEYLLMSSKPSKNLPNGMVGGNRTQQGDELQLNMTGDPDPAQSSSPYYKAYETSKKQAESTLDKESVPAAYKKQVKDYFDSIHP
jgi:hypothetical protein